VAGSSEAACSIAARSRRAAVALANIRYRIAGDTVIILRVM
jgi:hypothetical protein